MLNLSKTRLKTILDFVSKTRLKFHFKPNLYNNKNVKKEEYIVGNPESKRKNLIDIEKILYLCPTCKKTVTADRETIPYRLGRMHFYKCPACKLLLLALNDITPEKIQSLYI